MHRIYLFLLQTSGKSYTAFVAKAGLLVVLLCLFIVIQSAVSRWRRSRLEAQKNLLRTQFDAQIMESKIEIQEATFDSISLELHDNIGQLLSSAKVFIGLAERQMTAIPPILITANETLDKAIIEVRDLSRSLNKEWLEQFDLYQHLTAEINNLNAAGELQISVWRKNHVLPASSEEQFILYRLLQEGLQNVLKHAAAKNVTISIQYDDKQIEVNLVDDGVGFDIEADHTGIGLQNMMKRVRLLKGKINWFSSPAGTRVFIQFPLNSLEP